MWAERGISRLFFNTVPTDICPTASRASRTPVGKSRCPAFVRLLQRLHWWRNGALRMSSSKWGRSGSCWAPCRDCRGRGPGAPNRRWQYGWPLLLPCGSRIIQHTRTPVSELLTPSPHHLRRHDVRTIHLHSTAMDACRARTIPLSCL
jgi:hypothetical protein